MSSGKRVLSRKSMEVWRKGMGSGSSGYSGKRSLSCVGSELGSRLLRNYCRSVLASCGVRGVGGVGVDIIRRNNISLFVCFKGLFCCDL